MSKLYDELDRFKHPAVVVSRIPGKMTLFMLAYRGAVDMVPEEKLIEWLHAAFDEVGKVRTDSTLAEIDRVVEED